MPSQKFDVRDHVYAHRGLWSETATENGLAAFKAAAHAGVGVELDVRLTADGQPVVFHDATLSRLCGLAARLDHIALAALGSIRLPDGGAIPHLADVMAVLTDQPVLLELKVDDAGDDRIAHVVATLIGTLRQPCALMSFNRETVQSLRRLAPDRPVGLLIDNGDAYAVKDAVEFARQIGCDYIGPNIHALSITEQSEMPAVCWTIRDQVALGECLGRSAAPIFEGLPPHDVISAAASLRGGRLAG